MISDALNPLGPLSEYLAKCTVLQDSWSAVSYYLQIQLLNEERILGGKESCHITQGLNKDANLKYIVK